MNNIGIKTYEHIKELLYNKVNKEITISSEAMNYVFDYVDDLQTQLDSCIKSNKEIQQRIDKVIQYIEEHKRNVYDTFGEGIVFGEMGGIKEILDILRGEDNE